MSTIKKSSKTEVTQFLCELKSILNSENFNIKSDLDILTHKKHEAYDDPYTTQNTLLELEYDRSDIVRCLLSLNEQHYNNTIIDDKDPSLPCFYSFISLIESRDVYIKVKIRDKINNKVFCVSFHFARHPVKHPLPYENI